MLYTANGGRVCHICTIAPRYNQLNELGLYLIVVFLSENGSAWRWTCHWTGDRRITSQRQQLQKVTTGKGRRTRQNCMEIPMRETFEYAPRASSWSLKEWMEWRPQVRLFSFLYTIRMLHSTLPKRKRRWKRNSRSSKTNQSGMQREI